MTANDWSVINSIATCAAAISTASAAIAAFYALRGWKAQEKLKAYQKYKMSLDVLKSELSILPDSFSSTRTYSSYSSSDEKRPVAVRVFSKCSEAWVGYSVHQPTSEELDAWSSLFRVADAYLYAGGDRSSLDKPLSKAASINPNKSIFEKMRKLDF